jgi:non-ribosomal peptide synthase protein (TIGR01720 family)
VRNISASLTIEETALLVQELPKTLQANVLSILLTAFIKMLAQWTGSNFHAFFLVNNGRITPFPGVNLSRTVGNLILVPQIVLDVEGTAHLMEALEKIKTQLDRVPLYGMMWEWLPLNMTLKSELSFNYMGQQGRSEQVVSPWFRQAPESAGPVDDPQEEQWTLLGCTVIIIDKQLRVNLAYSENLFRQETIENLVSNYIEVLQHFIELTFRLPKFRPK